MCTNLGWWVQSEILFGLIVKWLSTNSLKRGNRWEQDAWFTLHSVAQCLGRPSDAFEARLTVPIFRQAIEVRPDAPPEVVANIVASLCEFHLDNWDDTDSDDVVPIFQNDEEHLLAVEIQAWLAMRDRLGFTVKWNGSHPLLDLPINNRVTGTRTFEPEPLAEEVLARVRSELSKLRT